MRGNLIKGSVISISIVAGALFLANNSVMGDATSPDDYQKWIAETYDFRFGANRQKSNFSAVFRLVEE